MLVRIPEQSLATLLSEHLGAVPPFERFEFAVAWARLRGVALVSEALEAYAGRSIGIVGLSGRGTSYEALYALRERLSELWVFHKHPAQIFHPKLYVFVPGPSARGRSAVAVIGSSNLSGAGLETNYEVSWVQELDPSDSEESQALGELQQYLDDLRESPFCHRVESPDFLGKLLEGGYVASEARLRARAGNSVARSGARVDGFSLPQAPPPPRHAVRHVVVPAPVEREPMRVEESREARAEREPSTDTLFFVRTLTENDLLKARRQRTGTWEPDLGLMARNAHPAFWGWPDEYQRVPGTNTRQWNSVASFHSRKLPEGTVQSVRLWFRPGRPGHAAEHRLRPATRVKDLVFPAEFDTNSLMVVQRMPGESEVAFRVDFLLPGDAGYDDYAGYLTERRPKHRFGYGITQEVTE